MTSEHEHEMTALREKLKELLVAHLSLEDVTPADIKNDEALFGDGLGLDSLDAVELVVLLQRNFGLQVKDIDQGRKIFQSIDTLARYVYEQTHV